MRFWARVLDSVGWGFVAGLAAAFIPEPVGGLLLAPVTGSLILLFGWVFVEAFMLSSFGATPGKAILGISVRRDDGSNLDFGNALSRSFGVWLWGLGLGLPLFALIAHIRAYQRLTTEGATSWDRSGGYAVRHAAIGGGRAALAALIILGAWTVSGWAALDEARSDAIARGEPDPFEDVEFSGVDYDE